MCWSLASQPRGAVRRKTARYGPELPTGTALLLRFGRSESTSLAQHRSPAQPLARADLGLLRPCIPVGHGKRPATRPCRKNALPPPSPGPACGRSAAAAAAHDRRRLGRPLPPTCRRAAAGPCRRAVLRRSKPSSCSLHPMVAGLLFVYLPRLHSCKGKV